MTDFYLLLLGSLCVFRLSHLLYGEDGPWDIFVRLRRLAGEGSLGGLLDCFYCLSVWIAAPFAYLLAETWEQRLLLWPALSAGAIVIERLTAERQAAPAVYMEEED